MNSPTRNLEARLLDALDPAQIMLKVGMVPDPWQYDVLRSHSRRILMVCSRRSGRTSGLRCAGLASVFVYARVYSFTNQYRHQERQRSYL